MGRLAWMGSLVITLVCVTGTGKEKTATKDLHRVSIIYSKCNVTPPMVRTQARPKEGVRGVRRHPPFGGENRFFFFCLLYRLVVYKDTPKKN